MRRALGPESGDTGPYIEEAAERRRQVWDTFQGMGPKPVINEEALYEALRTRRIAGAGIDVWYQYPSAPGQIQRPGRFPFHELDNIIMTPHKPTAETMAYRWRAIAGNISRLAQGEPLLRIVRP